MADPYLPPESAGAPPEEEGFSYAEVADEGPAAEGPSYAALAEEVDAEEAATDEKLSLLFRDSLGKDADRHARVRALQQQTGAHPELLDKHYEEMAQEWDAGRFDARKWREENPGLAAALLEHPDAAPIVHGKEAWLRTLGRKVGAALDFQAQLEGAAGLVPGENPAEALSKLSASEEEGTAPVPAPLPQARMEARQVDTSLEGTTGVSRLVALARAGFTQGQRQMESSLLWSEILEKRRVGEDTWALEKRALSLRDALVPKAYGQSALEELVLTPAELLPMQGSVLAGSAESGGLAYLGTAAVVGALTRDRQAAHTAGKLVGGQAAQVGAFLVSFNLEKGSAYAELLQAKTDDGKPVPEDVAAGAAILYGLVAAGLETEALSTLMPALGLPTFGKLGQAAQRGAVGGILKQSLKDAGFRALALEAARVWGKGVAGEAKEEALQSLAESLANYYARTRAAGTAQSFDTGEAFADAAQSAGAAALGTLPMGAPRFVGVAVREGYRESVDALGARRGKAVVQALQEADNPGPGAADVVATLIRRETERDGEAAGAMYVDAVAFQRFFQGGNVAEAAEKLLGEGGALRLQQALASGETVEVPLAHFAREWAGQPVAKALEEDVTTRPGGLTSRQRATREKEIDAEARALAEGLTKEKAALEAGEEVVPEGRTAEVEARLVDAVARRLKEVGAYSKREAQLATLPWREAIRKWASLFPNESPEALFSDFVLQVERAGLPPAPVAGARTAPATLSARTAPAAAAAFPEAVVAPNYEITQFGNSASERQPGMDDVDESPLPEGEVGDTSFDFGGEEAAPALPEQGLQEARAHVAFMRNPERKAQAEAFLAYATGETDTRPQVTAELERELAEFGVVDPQGFTFGEDGRDMARPLGGPRVRGEEPEAFRRIREEKADYEAGRMSGAASSRLRQPSLETPTLSALRERAQGATPEVRADDLYRDALTGHLNRRAWDALPRAAGSRVLAVSSPDVKALNDAEAGGHDTTNAFLRVLGKALDGVPNLVARSGTTFLVEVPAGEDAAPLVEKVRAALPDARLQVVSAEAADTDAAFASLDATTDAGRSAGTLPARGLSAFPVEEAGTFNGLPRDVAAPAMPASLLEAAAALSPQDFFQQAYLDADMPGVLSAVGYANAPRRGYSASLDGKGLKAVNLRFGREVGNAFLARLGLAAQRVGGMAVDFAHLSGDEFAAQAESLEALTGFLARLREEVRREDISLHVNHPETGEPLALVPDFRGEAARGTYGDADRLLNAAKRREQQPGGEAQAPGAAGGLPRGNGAEGAAGALPGQPAPPALASAQEVAQRLFQAPARARKKAAPAAPAAQPRNLLVQHNLSLEGLRNAVENLDGALPMPSLAVARVEHPLEQFGGVTLLGPSSLARPSASNPVFNADAYTPTQVRFSFKVDDKAVSRLFARLRPQLEALGVRGEPYVESYVEGDGDAGVMRSAEVRAALALAFLEEKGVQVPPMPRQAVEYRSETHPIVNGIPDFFVEYGARQDFQPGDEYHRTLSTYVSEQVEAEANQRGRDAHTRELWLARLREKYLGEDGLVPFATASRLVEEGQKVLEGMQRTEGPVDKRRAQDMVEQLLRPHDVEFEDWADEQVRGVAGERRLFAGFDVNGNRKTLPYNLKNVLALMRRDVRKTGRVQGGEGDTFGGYGPLRSQTARRFRSMAEVEGARDSLVPRQRHEALGQSLVADMDGLSGELDGFFNGKDTPAENAWEGLVLALQKMAEGSEVRRAMTAGGFDLPALEEALGQEDADAMLARVGDFFRRLQDAPSDYFEAKPQRAVPLSEFAAAVVPSNKAKAARPLLERAGVPNVVEYDEGNPDARRQAIASAAVQSNVLFQPAFHGTPHRHIARFTHPPTGPGVGALVYGWGHYFPDNRRVAEWYREVLSANRSRSGFTLDGNKVDAASMEHTALGMVQDATQSPRQSAAEAIQDVRQRLQAEVEQAQAKLRMEETASRKSPAWQVEQWRTAAQRTAPMLSFLETLTPERFGRYTEKHEGQVYKVEVPEDGQLLDWDAAMSAQPSAVLEALEGAGLIRPGTARALQAMGEDGARLQVATRNADGARRRATAAWQRGVASDEEVKRLEDAAEALEREADELGAAVQARVGQQATPEALKAALALRQTDGQEFYREMSGRLGGDKAASEALDAAGVPGLRYLDANSRADFDGTRNFVVWNEAAVNALETFYQGEEAVTEETARGYVDFARTEEALVARITLGRGMDKSTFLHESSHAFLELFGNLAERPDAPAALRQDWASALKWMGVEDRAGIGTAQHEKWADTWETYLREGKAPNAALRRAFVRFRLWLSRIYGQARIRNANLSEDIRGVFDRLLASDEEVARAKAATGMRPLWRSPEEAGMSPEEWQAYLSAQEEATGDAARRADMAAMKEAARETEAWWKEEERAQRTVAEEEWAARPDVRAWAYLREGVAGQRVRLSRAAVVHAVGPDNARRFGSVMVVTGGVQPDDVAAFFDYPTGALLLQSMLSLPERQAWVRERAAALMVEKYPDVAEERARLAQAAQEGFHGAGGGRWLLQEWRALQRKAYKLVWNPEANRFQPLDNGKGPPPIEAIERAARYLTEQTVVRRLDAGRALAAERAAATRVAEAAAKGNWPAAFTALQQRLLNHYLYRELTAAQEEREAFEELAAELARDKARARLGKASPVFRDGVDTLLEGLGLKEVEAREVPMASLDAVARAVEGSGTSVGFDVDALRALVSPPRQWKALTVAQLREVVAALKNIRAAASSTTTALVDGRRMEKEEVAAALVAEAEANLREKPALANPGEETVLEALGGLFNALDGSLLKPETLVGWLGGGLGSMWERAIFRPLKEAHTYEVDLLKQVSLPVLEALRAMPAETRRRLNEAVDGRALFPNHRPELLPRRRHSLLAMALNWGNDGNRQRLTDGRGITPAEVEAALSTLTREEWEWVQACWDAAESLWPLARAVEERDSGLAPPRVVATPVETPHGTFRGGYWPAVYDTRVDSVGERQELQAVADFLDANYTRPGTAHGHLKRRAAKVSGAIALDLGVVQNHLAQVTHDIAFREAVKSVAGLLLREDVKQALNRRLGVGTARQLPVWVKDVGNMRGAEAAAQHARGWDRLFAWAKGNLVTSALGYAWQVSAGDFSLYAIALREVPARHMAAALSDFMAHPFRTFEEALRLSPELRAREAGAVEELRREMRRALSKLPRAWHVFRDNVFVLMEWSARLTQTPVWVAAYRDALARGLPEADAVRHADGLVRRNVPSQAVVDKAGALRDKGFMGHILAMFSYLNTVHNQQRDDVQPFLQADGVREKLAATPRMAVRLLVLYFGTAVLSELLMGRGPGEDEEGEAWLLRRMLLAPLQPIPLVNTLASAAEAKATGRRANPRVAPGFSFVQPLVEAVGKVLDGDADGLAQAEAALRALGLTTGLPTRPATDALRYQRKQQ